MDSPLLTDESRRLILLEIEQAGQEITALEEQVLAFVEAMRSRIAQFAIDQDELISDYLIDTSALVDFYIAEMRRLIDDFETRLNKHLGAFSPDETHNGALDSDFSFTTTEAPYRPVFNDWSARVAPLYNINNHPLGDPFTDTPGEHRFLINQPNGRSASTPTTTYRDEIGYGVTAKSIGMLAPPTKGNRVEPVRIWLPCRVAGT